MSNQLSDYEWVATGSILTERRASFHRMDSEVHNLDTKGLHCFIHVKEHFLHGEVCRSAKYRQLYKDRLLSGVV